MSLSCSKRRKERNGTRTSSFPPPAKKEATNDIDSGGVQTDRVREGWGCGEIRGIVVRVVRHNNETNLIPFATKKGRVRQGRMDGRQFGALKIPRRKKIECPYNSGGFVAEGGGYFSFYVTAAKINNNSISPAPFREARLSFVKSALAPAPHIFTNKKWGKENCVLSCKYVREMKRGLVSREVRKTEYKTVRTLRTVKGLALSGQYLDGRERERGGGGGLN